MRYIWIVLWAVFTLLVVYNYMFSAAERKYIMDASPVAPMSYEACYGAGSSASKRLGGPILPRRRYMGGVVIKE